MLIYATEGCNVDNATDGCNVDDHIIHGECPQTTANAAVHGDPLRKLTLV